jgi:signal transduction histidine kinase
VSGAGGSGIDHKALLDRLTVGVLAVDGDLTVCYANLAARRLFHPEKLSAGRRLRTDRAPLEDIARHAFSRGLAAPTEIAMADGRVAVVEAHRSGHRGVVTLLLHDVSQRARASQAEHDFVVNAAHELLSPLTVIASASDVLQQGAKDDPEIRDRFIGHIGDASDRLIRVSRALLTLARAEAGVEPPRLELVRLRPVLDDVARVGEPEASVSCAADIAVLVERDLFEQALGNLVANAKRHARGDRVAISVDEGSDQTVGIEIVDPGTGILPEHLERVADRFYSGHGRDATGFGIGLSIAARSVEAFGGRLSLASTPGQGTRARIEVPTGRVITG